MEKHALHPIPIQSAIEQIEHELAHSKKHALQKSDTLERERSHFQKLQTEWKQKEQLLLAELNSTKKEAHAKANSLELQIRALDLELKKAHHELNVANHKIHSFTLENEAFSRKIDFLQSLVKTQKEEYSQQNSALLTNVTALQKTTEQVVKQKSELQSLYEQAESRNTSLTLELNKQTLIANSRAEDLERIHLWSADLQKRYDLLEKALAQSQSQSQKDKTTLNEKLRRKAEALNQALTQLLEVEAQLDAALQATPKTTIIPPYPGYQETKRNLETQKALNSELETVREALWQELITVQKKNSEIPQ